jgi:hypothetical protein
VFEPGTKVDNVADRIHPLQGQLVLGIAHTQLATLVPAGSEQVVAYKEQ